jgi:hypothetical protein
MFDATQVATKRTVTPFRIMLALAAISGAAYLFLR